MFSGPGGQNPFGSQPTQSPGSSMLAGTSTTSPAVPPQPQPASSLFSRTAAWPVSSAAEEQGLLAMPRRRKGRLLRCQIIYTRGQIARTKTYKAQPLWYLSVRSGPKSGGHCDQYLNGRCIGSILFFVTKYCSTRCLPNTVFAATRILNVVRRPLWYAPDSVGDAVELNTFDCGPVRIAL